MKARDRARVLPEAAPPSPHAQTDQLREEQLLCFRVALEAIAAGDPHGARIAQVALQAGGYAMTWKHSEGERVPE